MSWNIAYKISKAFQSIPDIEELESVLNRLYDFWISKRFLGIAYGTFLKFVWSWAFETKRLLPAEYTYVFTLNDYTPEEWESNTDLLNIQLSNDLIEYGLYTVSTDNPHEYWTIERTRERLAEERD